MGGRRWHWLLFAAASLLGSEGLVAAGSPGLSGRIIDVGGQRLQGVQVFLIVPGSTAAAVAEGLTGDDGSFRLGYPRPGTYLFAAVKSGYQTTFQRVDSWLRDRVVLVLRPLDDLPDLATPDDDAWVLRLPAPHILRDEDGLRSAVSPRRSGPRATIDRWLDGAVQQSFIVAGRSGAAGSRSQALGSETRLTLATVLTDQARLRFEGRHARIEPEAPSSATLIDERRDSAMQLGLDLTTAIDSSLTVSAFVDQADEVVGGSQRSWGYDASWSKQIDPRSHVRVRVDYSGLQSASDRSRLPESSRKIGAESSFESIAAKGHQVRVDFRAERVEQPSTLIGAGPMVAAGPLISGSGWSVRLDAEDAWNLSPAVTVTYGVDYRQQLEAAGHVVVAPRAGTVLLWRRARVEAGVSYHLESGAPSDRGSLDRQQSWGCDALVEVPLPAGVRVQAQAAFAPHQLDPLPGIGTDPLYLGRADTTLTRRGLKVEREFGGGSGFVEWIDGRAEGQVAPVFALDGPVHRLRQGILGFAGGRVGGRVDRSGTGVSVDYRRVTDDEPELGAEAPTQRQWGLMLTQDLPALDRPLAWRVVVAALAIRADEPSDAEADHRMSAGVSVLF